MGGRGMGGSASGGGQRRGARPWFGHLWPPTFRVLPLLLALSLPIFPGAMTAVERNGLADGVSIGRPSGRLAWGRESCWVSRAQS